LKSVAEDFQVNDPGVSSHPREPISKITLLRKILSGKYKKVEGVLAKIPSR
jgi:hypothetical protein